MALLNHMTQKKCNSLSYWSNNQCCHTILASELSNVGQIMSWHYVLDHIKLAHLFDFYYVNGLFVYSGFDESHDIPKKRNSQSQCSHVESHHNQGINLVSIFWLWNCHLLVILWTWFFELRFFLCHVIHQSHYQQTNILHNKKSKRSASLMWSKT